MYDAYFYDIRKHYISNEQAVAHPTPPKKTYFVHVYTFDKTKR